MLLGDVVLKDLYIKQSALVSTYNTGLCLLFSPLNERLRIYKAGRVCHAG